MAARGAPCKVATALLGPPAPITVRPLSPEAQRCGSGRLASRPHARPSAGRRTRPSRYFLGGGGFMGALGTLGSALGAFGCEGASCCRMTCSSRMHSPWADNHRGPTSSEKGEWTSRPVCRAVAL
eukprot:5858937-Pyramimonas_sp.AAC.1